MAIRDDLEPHPQPKPAPCSLRAKYLRGWRVWPPLAEVLRSTLTPVGDEDMHCKAELTGCPQLHQLYPMVTAEPRRASNPRLPMPSKGFLAPVNPYSAL